MYSLVNIFDVFLPQLLTYPNPADPLNSDAAGLYMKDHAKYEEKVRGYVQASREKYEARTSAKKAKTDMSSTASTGSGGPASGKDSNLSEEPMLEDPDNVDFALNTGEDDLDLEFED